MNIQQFITPQNQSQHDMRQLWFEYLHAVNPVGVNRVLNNYGFTDRMAPVNEEETLEAIENVVEMHGTDGIRDLMMCLPEFDAIRAIVTPKASPFMSIPINNINQVTQIPNAAVRNATGNETVTGLSIPVDDILKGAIIFGILYLLTQKL